MVVVVGSSFVVVVVVAVEDIGIAAVAAVEEEGHHIEAVAVGSHIAAAAGVVGRRSCTSLLSHSESKLAIVVIRM